jgi:hypothetical protein
MFAGTQANVMERPDDAALWLRRCLSIHAPVVSATKDRQTTTEDDWQTVN